MRMFMEDPAVEAAADQLRAALAKVAGAEVKNLLVVALIPDQPGSGRTQASVLYKGCNCPGCGEVVLTAASRPFGAGVEVEFSQAAPGSVVPAREVH